MAITDLLSEIIGAGRAVFERVMPDKAAADEAFREFEIQMARLSLDQDSGFRKFVIEYEGRISDIPKPVQYLRSSIRPILTLAISGLYGYGWLHPAIFSTLQMDLLQPAFLLVLVFWFGEKALTRTGLMDMLKAKREK